MIRSRKLSFRSPVTSRVPQSFADSCAVADVTSAKAVSLLLLLLRAIVVALPLFPLWNPPFAPFRSRPSEYSYRVILMSDTSWANTRKQREKKKGDVEWNTGRIRFRDNRDIVSANYATSREQSIIDLNN